MKNTWLIVISTLVIIPIILSLVVNILNENIHDRDIMFLNKSLENNETETCFKIMSKELKNECFLNLAKNLRSIQLCDNIINIKQSYEDKFTIIPYSRRTDPKDDCKKEVRNMMMQDALKFNNYTYCQNDQECKYEFATKLKDSNLCLELKEKNDICFQEIAKSTNDTQLCEQIKDNSIKQDCYYYFTSIYIDEKLCELIPDKKTNSCYFVVATNLSKSNLCKKAGEKETECYYKIALRENNLDLCENSGKKEGECIFYISRRLNESSHCIKAKEKEGECWNYFALQEDNEKLCIVSSLSTQCYYNLANQTNNEALCLRAGEKKSNCLFKIALAKLDPSICLAIEKETCPVEYPLNRVCTQIDSLSACIFLSSKSNSGFCEIIPNKFYLGKCYRNVAIELSDPELCEKAEDFTESCYHELAIKKNNSELCLKAGYWKEECLKKLNSNSVTP